MLLAYLDHFKAVNDVYDHDAGNQALVQTAKMLSGGLLPLDLVAR